MTYQKHKDNLFLLDQGILNIDVFRNEHKFGNHIGVETLTKVMASVFPKETGFHPEFFSSSKTAFTNLSTTFSEFIAEQQQQQPTADLSIIFVDFTPTDKIRGASTAEDFSNRVLVSTVGVYQTVGALYSCIDAECTSGNRYACRILNRGQFDCEYSIHECLFRDGKYITQSTPAKVNCIKDWDDSKIHNVELGQYGTQFIYHREIYILTGISNEWLSDEIVNSCCIKFTEFVASRGGNFGQYIPPFVFQSLLQHLHPSTNLKSSRSKTQQDTLDQSKVHDAYLNSKDLWEYQNIFDDPNKLVCSVINYPNQKHWIHIGIHASEHTIIVYDPLRNKNNTDIVGSVVQAYANCDFLAALEQQKAGTSEIPKWIQLDVDGQLQPDNHNCGVLSQISFFRAIRKLNEPGRTEVTAANLAAQWKCDHSIDAFKEYRKTLFILITESTDLTAFDYFYKFLQDIIGRGETLFQRVDSGARKKLGV